MRLMYALAMSLVIFFGAGSRDSFARTKTARPAHTPSAPLKEKADVPNDVKGVASDFNAWLDAVEQSGQVSGLAAAIVSGDKILLQRGIGYADAAQAKPVTPDSVFRLASLSKAFASALTAMLVDEGMLS